MMAMLITGQRVFGAIGFVAMIFALFLWGDGDVELAFSANMKLMKWYPLLTLPLFKHLGFDLVWYGVLYTIICQIAYMTPPFGYNLFLMKAKVPNEVTLSDIYRSVTPFVLIMVFGLALVMAFPQLALWLPQQITLR